jgi:MFS family permease
VTWKPAAAPGKAGASAGQVWRQSIGDIGAGLVYIKNEPLMRALLGLSFVASVFAMPYLFLLPGYVAEIFDGGGTQVGLMISVSAVGALAGALVLASLPNRSRGLILLGGLALLGLSLILFAQTTNYFVAGGIMIAVGLGSALRQALTQGLLQHHVEDAYRGRVMAVFMMQVSMMQFGTFVVGVIAEIVGIQVAFAGTGVGLLIVTAGAFWLLPQIRRVQ